MQHSPPSLQSFGFLRSGWIAGLWLCAMAAPLSATNWEEVDLIYHSTYQAIREDSGKWVSDYPTTAFPLRLRGVVLNASEDWLDPTADYDPGPDYHLGQLGGQAEIAVQTIDAENDFGGTFCWMGQNLGNTMYRKDPIFNYPDDEWYAELNRLGFSHPVEPGPPDPLPPEQLVRPGDYIEVRARAGMEYKTGKMNVNEMHYPDDIYDFEFVVLEQGRGWDAPTELTLAELKESDDSFIFNTQNPRASGPEYYQGTLVTLQNVTLSGGTWGPGNTVTVSNGGRTFSLRLGLGAGLTNYPAAGTFHVTGIMDQDSTVGNNGYRLLVMDSGDVFQRWAGGSGQWSSASNWGGNALLDGQGAHFSGSGGTATNDGTDRAVGGIVFESGAGAYTLAGNPITLSGDVVSFSSQTQTVALDIALGDDDIMLYAADGDLVLENALENDGYIRKIGSGAVVLPGGVSGEGILHVANGSLTTSSIVQHRLTIGGVAEGGEEPETSAAPVPEPSVWLLLLAAAVFGKHLFSRLFQKYPC
ncbi:MAG: hypothetical protein JXB10_15955 [Pirellulales bacterium]|nr:hypothetical protein [Pirellulales bacterium]